jgi:signal transduction histidine kinase
MSCENQQERRPSISEQLKRSIIEAERRRVSMDLHDDVLQSMYAAMLRLEGASESLDGHAQVRDEIEDVISELRRITAGVRDYALGLRGSGQDNLDFAAEMLKLIRDFRAATNLGIELRMAADPSLLAPDQAVELLHITREALWNAAKHGRPSHVGVLLADLRTFLSLCVTDDGTGFDCDTLQASGQGLQNMEERSRKLGATLIIDSMPGNGTCVLVLLPLTNVRGPREGPQGPDDTHPVPFPRNASVVESENSAVRQI